MNLKISNSNPRLLIDDLGNPMWLYQGDHIQDIEKFLRSVKRLKERINDLESQLRETPYNYEN
jgi:hypothetical protein